MAADPVEVATGPNTREWIDGRLGYVLGFALVLAMIVSSIATSH